MGVTIETKEQFTCVGCKQIKPGTQYYASTARNNVAGRNPYCKQCCKVNRALEAVRKRDKTSKISIRQRIRAQSAYVECDATVELVEVYRQAYGICGICGLWVQPRLASMDHKKPIKRGGSHTYGNLQLTHIKCNLIKGAKDHGHG